MFPFSFSMWIPSPSYAQIYTNFHSPRLLWSETHTHTHGIRKEHLFYLQKWSCPFQGMTIITQNTRHPLLALIVPHLECSAILRFPVIKQDGKLCWENKKKEHTHPAVEMMSKEKLSRQKHRPSSLLSHTVPKSCKVIWTRSNSDGQSHTWRRQADGNHGKSDPFILLFIFLLDKREEKSSCSALQPGWLTSFHS